MQNYSATYTPEHLYRNEVKLVVDLQRKGLSKLEIRDKVIEDNLFQCRSEDAIKRLFSRVYKRTNVLDEFLRNVLIEESRPDGNAILLYGFLQTYRFPREFVMEVIHYNWIANKTLITNGNITTFFDQKAEQDDIVRNWSGQTNYSMKQKTLKILSEAELLKRTEEGFLIKPIPLSSMLREYIKNNKEYHDMITLTLNN